MFKSKTANNVSQEYYVVAAGSAHVNITSTYTRQQRRNSRSAPATVNWALASKLAALHSAVETKLHYARCHILKATCKGGVSMKRMKGHSSIEYTSGAARNTKLKAQKAKSKAQGLKRKSQVRKAQIVKRKAQQLMHSARRVKARNAQLAIHTWQRAKRKPTSGARKKGTFK